MDERASYLILSLIADSIASRHRLRTITDRPVGYTLNVLNNERGTFRSDVVNRLASAIITTEIPDAVASLTPKQFVNLRKRFEELRTVFQRAVRDICDDHMLHEISDQSTLDEAVREIVQQYDKQVEMFRKSVFGAKIGSWVPFSVGVLGSSLGLPGNLSLSIAGFGLGVAVQVYEMVTASRDKQPVERSQHLISGLKKELLATGIVERLALSPLD